MGVVFKPGNHSYWVDGERYTGVTTIIDGGVPKPALVWWAGKTVAEFVAENPGLVNRWQAELDPEAFVKRLTLIPNGVRDDAARIGHDVHDLCERWLKGEEIEVADEYVPYVEGFIDLCEAFGIEPVLIETTIVNREHRYTGRLDCLGRVRAFGDRLLLIDWKTSNSVYGDTSLQGAAYAKAEAWVSDDDPDTEHPMPQVDGVVVVHVTAEGSNLHWLCRDRAEIDAAFEDFLHAAHTHRNTKTRKDRLSEPVPFPTNQGALTA